MDVNEAKKNWKRGLWREEHINALVRKGHLTEEDKKAIMKTEKTDFDWRRKAWKKRDRG